jgi:hypothetical protein
MVPILTFVHGNEIFSSRTNEYLEQGVGMLCWFRVANPEMRYICPGRMGFLSNVCCGNASQLCETVLPF